MSLHYSFNPRVFADVFVQYNQDIDKVLTNVRFNWIHHPLSQLSLVFTEERLTGLGADVSLAFIVKYTHLMQV